MVTKICFSKKIGFGFFVLLSAIILVFTFEHLNSVTTSTSTRAANVKQKRNTIISKQVQITPTPLVFGQITTPGEDFSVPASELSIAIAAGEYTFNVRQYVLMNNLRPSLKPTTNIGLTTVINNETWYGYVIRYPNAETVVGYSEKMKHTTYFLTTNPPIGNISNPKTMWMKVSADVLSDETLKNGTLALQESIKLLEETLKNDGIALKTVFPNYFEPHLRYINYGDNKQLLARFMPDFYVAPGSGFNAQTADSLFEYGRAYTSTNKMAGEVLQASYDNFYKLAIERGVVTFDAHLGNFIYIQGPKGKIYSFLLDIDTPGALNAATPFEYIVGVTDHFQELAKGNGFKLELPAIPEKYWLYKGNVVTRVKLIDGTADILIPPGNIQLVKDVLAKSNISSISKLVGVEKNGMVILKYNTGNSTFQKRIVGTLIDNFSLIGVGGKVWDFLAKGAPALWFIDGAIDIDTTINLTTNLYVDQARTNGANLFVFSQKFSILFDQIDSFRKNLPISSLKTLQKCPSGYLTPTPINMVVGGSGIYPNYCLATDKTLDQSSRQLIQYTFGENIDTIAKAAYTMGKSPIDVYTLINKGMEKSEMPFPVVAKFIGGMLGAAHQNMFDSFMVSALVADPYDLVIKNNERALLIWTKLNGTYVPRFYILERRGLSVSYEIIALDNDVAKANYVFDNKNYSCDIDLVGGNKKNANITLTCK